MTPRLPLNNRSLHYQCRSCLHKESYIYKIGAAAEFIECEKCGKNSYRAKLSRFFCFECNYGFLISNNADPTSSSGSC
jgi:ribosomal protein L37E